MMSPWRNADCLVVRAPHAPPAASRQPVEHRDARLRSGPSASFTANSGGTHLRTDSDLHDLLRGEPN